MSAGVITLSGRFLERHLMEVLKLIMDTEEMAKLVDMQVRIEGIGIENSQVIVRTSSSELAEQMAKRLYRIFGGDLSFFQSCEPSGIMQIAWDR